MIETLDRLTVAQFVDLLCGDVSVLLPKHEIASPEKLTIASRNIIFQYREIADISGVRSYIVTTEELMKAKMNVVFFTMCNNLVSLEKYEEAKDILSEYGINARTMTKTRLEAEIKYKLERARYEITQIEKDNEKDSQRNIDIRKEFDSQTASLMAHFKFQIDTNSMKASLYAHLVARFNREIKAQMEAMKKR